MVNQYFMKNLIKKYGVELIEYSKLIDIPRLLKILLIH